MNAKLYSPLRVQTTNRPRRRQFREGGVGDHERCREGGEGDLERSGLSRNGRGLPGLVAEPAKENNPLTMRLQLWNSIGGTLRYILNKIIVFYFHFVLSRKCNFNRLNKGPLAIGACTVQNNTQKQ